MPVSPWKEGVGRILAVWVFMLLGAVLLLISGSLCGAEFDGGSTEILKAVGFSFLTAVASVGVGLIISSLVKGESASTHTGVALTLLTYFLGGMAMPYGNLPKALKAFARLHPVSSANASMIYLLEGETFVGYNPLSAAQTASTVLLTGLVFAVGLVMYSRLCWRKR
jgi:ABC-type multidrug transport system permease subunit